MDPAMGSTDAVRDTSPEAAREQIRLLRAAGIAGRIAALLEMSDEAVAMTRQALRRVHPGETERDIDLAIVRIQYGEEAARGVSGRLARGA
jgi:Rv0078B-related antitoxin